MRPDERTQMLLYASGFMLLLILIEAIWDARTHARENAQYGRKDTWTNILAGVGNLVAGRLQLFYILPLFYAIYRITPLDVPHAWWSYAVCLVLFDFCFYWAHRFGHETRIGWSAHVTHHSSQKFNMSVAVRQAWTQQSTMFFFFLPIPVLGFPIELILVVQGVHTLYQFPIHTQVIKKMWAPIEWIMNTPSHHRVHHGSNPIYLDKNYAGVFIIWDRLFGTFQAELDAEPVRYGLTKNINTYHPVAVQLHEWRDMFRDVFRAKTLRQRLNHLFRGPGWQPAATPETAPPSAETAPPPTSAEWVRQ